MVTLQEATESLLQKPSNTSTHKALSRASSTYQPLNTFHLDKARSYKQQYGDMYFLRLTKLRPVVEQAAVAAGWHDTVVGGHKAQRVDRVLDVQQGELCWVTGTVYMDMHLKPSILEDVSKDRWISAPVSTQKYYASGGEGDDDKDQIMLEDDSGRVRLVGDSLKGVRLVTGCVVAVMGTENANGEFEILDIVVPDLAPQPERWALSKSGSSSKQAGGKIAIVSGLSFSGTDASYAFELDLLLEFLLGEALGPSTQSQVSSISRLIIAGDSISSASTNTDEPGTATAVADKKNKKYGYDASSYNAIPSQLLDSYLAELLPSIPITLLPGSKDPANASFPQQPIHTAMFPTARAFSRDPTTAAGAGAVPGWFDMVTNPFEAEIEGWRVLGTAGQNVDDVFKYIDSDDRLGMMDAMCRWRCCAPTAPDTLWSYPFQEDDPFVLNNCPHLYFVGNQPEFGTRLIHGPAGQTVRLITVPSFSESKEVVLVDMETLEVSRVKIVTA